VDLSGEHIHRLYSGAEETTAGLSKLPAGDAEYLADRGIAYDVIEQGGQVALLLRQFALPAGKFQVNEADFLVLLPAVFPDAGPDMFYAHPWLKVAGQVSWPLAANQPFPFSGVNYQRWSRHSQIGRPGKDGVRTVLLRIGAALRTA
jgi:hypothetical protein